MTTLRSTLAAALTAAALVAVAAAPASALGLKDCSDKYTAAKNAGTVGSKTFAEFQKAECGADAKPVAAPVKPAEATTKAAPAAAADKKVAEDKKAADKAARAEKRKADKAAKEAAAKAAASMPVKDAVFPTKIADEFKSKKPSKARFATCLAQYKTNKATNANGGMKWVQKGGGYYAQCNKKLKG